MNNPLNGVRVLVTGGAGFIGSNLVRRLLGEGAYVRIFDNFSTGKRDNIAGVINDSKTKRLDIFEGDLRDFALILEATLGMDLVFHEAALPSVIRSVKAPNTTNDVNITGTLNLLEACKVNHVRRVIYASSSSIYGDSEELPKNESMIPNPLSPYAVSKIAGEYYMKTFHRLYNIETVILRYFNVYGPYQDPSSEYSGVISKFITGFIGRNPITVYGDGNQTRDFTYVDDVVEANILAADALVSGEVFNVAGGKRYSINEMIAILKDIFNIKEYEVVYSDTRPGDIKHSLADVLKVNKSLNFKAQTSFEEGLRETVAWYLKNVSMRQS